MSTPSWYIELVELDTFIKEKNWATLHERTKELTKTLYSKAPSVINSLQPVVLLSMNTELSEGQIRELKKAYNEAVDAADEELATDDFTRILKEEEILDELDILSEQTASSTRIITNYWWGESSSNYQTWLKLKEEIETKPLTRLGRLRLLARHETVGRRILPSFLKMVVQLWPIVAIWVIQKVGTLIISSAISKKMEERKLKKQIAGFKDKIGSKDFSVASLKKQPRKRKKK